MERYQLIELVDGLEKVYHSSPPIAEALGEIKEILKDTSAHSSTREQVEALRGEWIKRDGYTECSKCEYWYPSGEVEEEDDRTPFCPRCGSPMTDEAVEFTLRRLEALYETKAD